MPIADFLKVIDELRPTVDPHSTTIVITGGEPLMRNDLEQVGNELYKREFPWGMVTNGMLLTKERLYSLLNAGLRSITISLDGLEGSHNWLRNHQKSFQNASRAIQLLPTIPNLEYDVVTCANQRNLNELPAIAQQLINWGVKNWRIFTIFPIGRALQNNELQLNPVQFKQVFDFIKQTRKEGKINVSYGCEGYLGSYEGEVRDNFFFCQAGVTVASVLVDGTISACPNLRERFKQGSIYSNSFTEVWENNYAEFRNRKWMKTGICANCKSFDICQGNGMHLRNENGELMFCHLKKIEEGKRQEKVNSQ